MNRLIGLAGLIAGLATIYNMAGSSESFMVKTLAALSGGFTGGAGYAILVSKSEDGK